MPAIVRGVAVGAILISVCCSSAGAVGLGPLTIAGVTDSESKGFYLTLLNPYPTQERFQLYAIELDSERPVTRVRIPISRPLLGSKAQRRTLVISTGLARGETYTFRVCAERVEAPGKELIHARVCSKLTAHRVV